MKATYSILHISIDFLVASFSLAVIVICSFYLFSLGLLLTEITGNLLFGGERLPVAAILDIPPRGYCCSGFPGGLTACARKFEEEWWNSLSRLQFSYVILVYWIAAGPFRVISALSPSMQPTLLIFVGMGICLLAYVVFKLIARSHRIIRSIIARPHSKR
jgi:hypothetical protein